MTTDSKHIAWAIAFLAAGGAWLLSRRKSNPQSTVLENMKENYNQAYDYIGVRPLSRGYRNNNPVNIDYNPANKWVGQTGVEPEGRFAQFIDMPHGYRAAFVLLRGKGYISGGRNTIEKIITKFAPNNENYTAGYIENVSRMTGIPKDQVISPNDRDALTAIVYAMSIVENGTKVKDENGNTVDLMQTYGLPNMDIINQGWDLI